MKYSKMQLKNTMNALFVESHKSPVVSVQLWVKTGSADEVNGEEGLSHFIEHLVFKGTEKYKVGEIAQIIEGSGGELNAYTSFDQTVFYVTISKEYLDVAMDAISEMMGFPTFDEDEINNEREVVIEEIKRGMDSPGRRSSQLLFSTMYKKHPYYRPVIGYEKIIREVSKSKIVQYFNRRYVPENMTLVVAGDFDKSEAKKLSKKYFEAFKYRKLKKVKRAKEEKQISPRIKVEKADFKESLLYIAWPVPNIKNKDIPALDVLGLILGQGTSSRLVNNLRLKKPLFNSVGSSTYTPLDPGFFAISASVNEKTFKEALDELTKTIEDFLTHGPTVAELKKAKINFEADEFYFMETVEGLARKVGTYQHLFQDYKYFNEFNKQVAQLTVEDVHKVAKKYLKPDNINISMLSNLDEKEVKTTLKAWLKSYKKAYSGVKIKGYDKDKARISKFKITKSTGESSKLIKETLDCGQTIYFYPTNDTPVISLKTAYVGGVRLEADAQRGVTEMLSRTWGSGSKSKTEEETFLLMDNLASSVSAFGGRNTVGMSMTTLSAFEDEMLELYTDLLLNPRFDEDILQREKQIIGQLIDRRNDNPAQKCIMQFNENFFHNHPYALDMLAEKSDIEAITNKNLTDYLAKVLTAKNGETAICGSVNVDSWMVKLNELTKQIKAGEKQSSEFKFSPPEENIIKFTSMNKEQSHVVMGYPGLTFNDSDRYTLSLIQSILSGQGGRLFIELRDKESLAYSVSPIQLEGIDAGYFGGYIACSPDKVDKSINMLKAEFDKLCVEKVKAEELESAKKYIIGKHDISLQRNSAIASGVLFDSIYGNDPYEAFKFAEIIKAITADDIQRVAERIFSKPSLTSVVGQIEPSSI